MLTILLAAFLLVIYPAFKLWTSLRAPSVKPPRPPMRRYAMFTVRALVLSGIAWAGCVQAGYSARQLGLDVPLSSGGKWGLACAALLAMVMAVLAIRERRMPAEVRAEQERGMLASPMPWPRTAAEACAFAFSITLMMASWEVLYRGLLLLLLAPAIGMPLAVAASATAYAVGHGYKSPRQLGAALASAFVFTIAYALSGSLWWLIIIHAILPLSAIPAALRAHRLSAAGAGNANRAQA